MWEDLKDIEKLTDSIYFLARSITPSAAPGTDPYGGHIESLTEAVMSVTHGLHDIACAIREYNADHQETA